MRPRWEPRLEVEEVDEQVDEAVKAVAVALVETAMVELVTESRSQCSRCRGCRL